MHDQSRQLELDVRVDVLDIVLHTLQYISQSHNVDAPTLTVREYHFGPLQILTITELQLVCRATARSKTG